MIFEYEYKPVIEDFTNKGTLSLTAILKSLENAGNAHSDYAGDSIFAFGESACNNENCSGASSCDRASSAESASLCENKRTRAWVLTDWMLQINSDIKYGENLKVQTWAETLSSPLVVTRNFILTSNNEQKVIAMSKWILLDLEKNRPCKIEDDLLKKYTTEDKKVFEGSKLSKIKSVDSWQSQKEINLRRSDFDFNDHVHNLSYLDFALEVLPDDLYQNLAFKNIRISYKAAIKDERKIICTYSKVEDSHVVAIYNEKNELKTTIMFE